MQCSAVLAFLFVICLPITAEPVGSSPEENKAQYPAVPASFKPVREEAILQLADFVKHGDTLLKERLQTSYNDLREELKQGDSLVKDQLKDGDSRIKEELDEDVTWLKEKLRKGQERMKQDLAEEEIEFTSEMSDLKEAFAKLQGSVKSSSAVTDDLKQQMDDVQAELGRTRDLLQTTQTELDNTKEELGSTKQKMETLETELGSTKELLGSTKELLDNTTQTAETTEQELHRTRQELQTAQAEVGSLKAEVDGLQSSHRPAVPGAIHVGEEDQAVTDTGSTFTRWGRTGCPDNTSLVYSGVAGGSSYDHTGGASNYLCLVRDPQLDTKTAVPGAYNYLFGAQYEFIQGHYDQDVVCAVCRAPHPTSIMIPATLTCPDGWTSQYKGHLMSGHYGHKGRSEYVCVDEIRENDPGGHEDKVGAMFYHVITVCGSLPCPPYVNNVVTTCVVCSQ